MNGCLKKTGFWIALAGVVLLSSCGGRTEERRALAVRMASFEGGERNEKKIREIKRDIRKVQKEVETTLKLVRKEGTYWRLLGLKYMDSSMWGEALEAFDNALNINPNNAVLLYNRALCAAQFSRTADTPGRQNALLLRALEGYRQSLTVDPSFTPSMYAQAVLLVFELKKAAEAVPLLEKYLEIERSNISGRFLLARAYVETGKSEKAMRLYDEITQMSADKADVLRAKDLYARVKGGVRNEP